VSAYYDVHVFRKVYLAGQEEPFGRSLLAPNAASPGAALEEFVRALFQRALLASHTLAPDRENLDGWLDGLLNSVQPLYVAIDRYCRIFERPDPEKMGVYGVETVFYVESDPVIRLARAVQAGQDVSDADFSAALATDANPSAYARALVLGMTKLRDASAWWQGRAVAPPDIWQ